MTTQGQHETLKWRALWLYAVAVSILIVSSSLYYGGRPPEPVIIALAVSGALLLLLHSRLTPAYKILLGATAVAIGVLLTTHADSRMLSLVLKLVLLLVALVGWLKRAKTLSKTQKQ